MTVAAACAFGVGVLAVKGKESALEYFAGYLVEQSLSVDNIFVFVLLFDYFKGRRLLYQRWSFEL